MKDGNVLKNFRGAVPACDVVVWPNDEIRSTGGIHSRGQGMFSEG